MHCHCCGVAVSLARKVKLRLFLAHEFTAADVAGMECLVFRWSFVCPACYSALDSAYGCAVIGGREFNISGRLRHGRAALLDGAKYLRFLRKEAARLGPAVSSWLRMGGGAVFNVAQAISGAATYTDLPILADALEEAGCADRDLLAHCRHVGPHLRASWVVDLLLLAAGGEGEKAREP